jgi:hypothetical protein
MDIEAEFVIYEGGNLIEIGLRVFVKEILNSLLMFAIQGSRPALNA